MPFQPSRTVAKHLADQLVAWGVKRVYGVIGDANLYFLDELAKNGQIQYIPCRTENAAGLMASAEAKLTGKLGVCVATSGPGVTLLLNGLADASVDQAPVLAITGQVEKAKLGTGSKQNIDQQRLLDPIASYSTLVADGKGFPIQLNQAYLTAVARGSVSHLSIPKDVWRDSVTGPFFPPASQIGEVEPDQQMVRRAIDAIQQAERPVILAGRGIESVAKEVLLLAEKITAPILVTMPAKTILPNEHPWFVGGLGQAGSESATELLQSADLCLILGATWWPEDFVPPAIPSVQVDRIPENIGRTHPCAVGLVGDLKQVVPELLVRVTRKENSAWERDVQRMKRAWEERIKTETQQQKHPLAPQRIFYEIGQKADDHALFVLDVGDHTLWFERACPLKPGQDVLVSGRWRTLGFALPAAIAASLADPGRQVVAIVGDGGFMQTMAELATAQQWKASFAIFLINNGSYAMEKNRMKVEGLNTVGTDLANPDFVRLAESFGIKGIRIEREEELSVRVEEALDGNQLTMVDILAGDPIIPHTKM